MGLEEAEFTDAFGGDAGGGEVGDAAGGELDADVGDVGATGKDGQADGVDRGDRRLGERQDDVEVVDHEVEDDIGVEGTRRKNREAVRLEKHGATQQGQDGLYGRVEPFEMADGKDAIVFVGQGDQVVGFVESRGDGFFDQHMDVGLKQLGRDLVVAGGGGADAGGVDVELAPRDRGQKRLNGKEGCGRRRGCCAFGARRIGVNYRGEMDGVTGGLELAIDADVVAAERAGTANGDLEGQCRTP